MFDADEFFTYGEAIVRAGGGEAASRTAVGRLYYSCYIEARDSMFGDDAVNWRGRGRRPSHRAVIEAAERALPPGPASQRFKRLKAMREMADYIRDPAHPEMQALFAARNARDWADLADEALGIARDLLPLLRQLPPAPPAP